VGLKGVAFSFRLGAAGIGGSLGGCRDRRRDGRL